MDATLKQKYEQLVDGIVKGSDTTSVVNDILQIKLGAVAQEKNISLALYDYIHTASEQPEAQSTSEHNSVDDVEPVETTNNTPAE